MSQSQVAKAFKVATRTVALWEQNGVPVRKRLHTLTRLFGLDAMFWLHEFPDIHMEMRIFIVAMSLKKGDPSWDSRQLMETLLGLMKRDSGFGEASLQHKKVLTKCKKNIPEYSRPYFP